MPAEGEGGTLGLVLLAPAVTVMVVGKTFWTKDVGVTVGVTVMVEIIGVTVMVDVRTGGATLDSLSEAYVSSSYPDNWPSILSSFSRRRVDLRRGVLVTQLPLLAHEGGCEAGKKQHTIGEVRVHDVFVLLAVHLMMVLTKLTSYSGPVRHRAMEALRFHGSDFEVPCRPSACS